MIKKNYLFAKQNDCKESIWLQRRKWAIQTIWLRMNLGGQKHSVIDIDFHIFLEKHFDYKETIWLQIKNMIVKKYFDWGGTLEGIYIDFHIFLENHSDYKETSWLRRKNMIAKTILILYIFIKQRNILIGRDLGGQKHSVIDIDFQIF